MQHLPSAGFTGKDVAEIAVGACVMAFPVAVTEEVWNLGTELSFARCLLFTLGSLLALGFFTYFLHRRDNPHGGRAWFLNRLLTTYGITLVICALLLFGVDRLDFELDPIVGVKRTILVAFPASFAATVVDSMSAR